MDILTVENLSFSYPKAAEKALDNISFTLQGGDFCVVCGKSGSGKSTLLRLLKKEIAPFGNISGNIEEKTDKIGFVGQSPESNLITDTVFGNLAFGLENAGLSKSEIELKIAETVSYFNINKYINEKIENLSGGTKQLIALAAAMALAPEILVLDEPVSSLDPVSAQMFMNCVLKLNREQGTTVILSEHRAGGAFEIADKVLFLENGRQGAFAQPRDFADYLIKTNNDMQEILEPFTLLLENHPLEFSRAREQAKSIEAKPFTRDNEKGEIALTVKGLSFAYGKRLPDILFDLNYKAYKGKINVILGANASGKTTLLKCISKILKPYSGKVKASGKTAYMPQEVNTLFLEETVWQEVPSEELLKKTGLERLKNANPFDLSGGEAQRLAIAKMLMSGADILLLDEPTKSVDASFKKELALILRELCRQGKTVVVVTHDLEFAGRYADYCAFLFDGKIISEKERREFFASLSVYTTSLSRLTNGRVISIDDAKETL